MGFYDPTKGFTGASREWMASLERGIRAGKVAKENGKPHIYRRLGDWACSWPGGAVGIGLSPLAAYRSSLLSTTLRRCALGR